MDNETAVEIHDLLSFHLHDGPLNPPRLLDYGSGRGYQYLAQRMHEVWGGLLPVCYDPGVGPLSTRPAGTFCGVICTDVLEHIPEDELDTVLTDIFGFVEPNGFVYLKISTVPSRKVDDDGSNLHVTVKPCQWWHDKISKLNINNAIVVIKCTQ
jgi:hypothetical protein